MKSNNNTTIILYLLAFIVSIFNSIASYNMCGNGIVDSLGWICASIWSFILFIEKLENH